MLAKLIPCIFGDLFGPDWALAQNKKLISHKTALESILLHNDGDVVAEKNSSLLLR